MIAEPDLTNPWWWLLRGAAIVFIAGSLMPYIRTGKWFVRLWDFPRVQLACVCLVIAVVHATFVLAADRTPRFDIVLAGGTALAGVSHVAIVARYTQLFPRRLRPAERTDLHLVVANVDFRNPNPLDAAARIADIDPDVMLLVEPDARVLSAFASITSRYPHRIEEARDGGVGIALWSKLRIEDDRVEHLVSDSRPSLHATLYLEDGRCFRFIGLHPTPPALPRREGGRHDSRVRDAELVVAGEAAGADPDTPWAIAGDFNDVTWSRTSRLFERISGLADPRVGRAVLGTYHARYPLLRYPLDHAFFSPQFRVRSITRERIPGSDHLALSVRVQLDQRLPQGRPQADGEERSEASKMTEDDGERDADRNGCAPV